VEDTVHVLVVDDEEILRSLLEKILSKEGYHVYLASSGNEALRILDENPVGIVVSDIRMPEMDGYALLKAIKRDHPDVAVIMMTAYADACSVKDVLLLGADDYITKPFKSVEICMIIERAYWRAVSNRGPVSEPLPE
jgi:DNA-binding NtrC family response regulator